jgi:prolyl oligopeptidase
MYYNFWRDEQHVQGIWRKCTLESYQTAAPEWQTVLDVDALEPPTEGTAKTWVWHGSRLLDEGPGCKWDRAIISLSPGGSDADTCREMDLVAEQFIAPEDGGFAMPKAAKSQVAYRSRDELLVGTDFDGTGASMTDSGYPRVVKSWKRGTPLSEAKTVFEAEQTDIAGGQWAYYDRGFVHEFQRRSVTFYTSKHFYRALSLERLATVSAADEDAPFAPVPIPDDAEISTFAGDAMITLRSDWTPPGDCPAAASAAAAAGGGGSGGGGFRAGALIVAPMAEVMAEDWSHAQCLFAPTASKSLQSTTTTKDYVVLSVLSDVRTTLEVWRKAEGEEGVGGASFVLCPAPEGVEAVGVGEDVAVSNPNRDNAVDNRLFLWRDGYLVPDTLELVPDVSNLVAPPPAGDGAAAAAAPNLPLKSKPAMFDAAGLVVEQHFATSKDGTKVPYFVMKREGLAADGGNPTLLDAYGGFEISMLPYYSAGVGAAWLEKGGVKVIANIRGGGEYGERSWN